MMNLRKDFLLLFSCLVIMHTVTGQTTFVSGHVSLEMPSSGDIIIQLYQLKTVLNGHPKPLTKNDIYETNNLYRTVSLEQPGSFIFSDLAPGYFSIVAFQDIDKDGKLSFNPPEPLGWYADYKGEEFSMINLNLSAKSDANITLRRPTPFDKIEKRMDHGALMWIKGLPVLQLWGTAAERGYAHGYLVGQQIIDFFEFYVLEDSWRTPERYEKIFVPFIKEHTHIPEVFLEECDAVINGMKDSGTNMKVKFLGRDFTRSDLLAVNAYIERRAAFPGPASSCTQFAFWGDQTKGSELKGGLIAARNMDGECDIRKVTVSHFLLFAVDPSEPGKKRWVSAMWPGFVGTISGINEEGLYSMENAGGSGPGPVPYGVVPCSLIERNALENRGKEATPENMLEWMRSYTCSTGGITAAGSIIMWAVPNRGQEAPAFIFEGGRTGYAMRKPVDVRPKEPTNIMASNYHKVYGYNVDQPNYSLGRPVSFSSLWRYEAGMQTLEAWSREKKPLGLVEAKHLLQRVAHGTTEYSVIFLANEMRILVAVDDLKTNLWDAPYLNWTEYDFDDLFDRN